MGEINKLIIFLALFFVLSLSSLSDCTAVDHDKLLELSNNSTWRSLIHSTEDFFNENHTSEVDSSSFFLSENGKHNLYAELESTTKYFFSPDVPNTERIKTICKFPARYEWLRKQLKLETEMPVENICPDIKAMRRQRGTKKISLIFAESFLDNPASMFGHTFLRFENSYFKQSRLFDQTLNFAADSKGVTGIEMALRGLFGGFEGRFFGGLYYARIKQYGDIDHRDLWEYPLNLNEEELRFLELHLWELKDVYFDYYFVDENCSYHLLSFLKVIRPNLNSFLQQLRYVIPADTIRALKSAGLIDSNPIRRISQGNLLLTLEEELSFEEKLTAKNISQIGIPSSKNKLGGLSLESQIKVLNAADIFLAFEESKNTNLNSDGRAEIAQTRSKLEPPQSLPARSQAPLISEPLKGHKPSRIRTVLGQEHWEKDDRFFYGLSSRPALHSLLDPEEGYLKNAELIFLEPEARFYPDVESLSLERMTLVQIKSLPPRKFFLQPYSWGMNMEFKRIRIEDEGREMALAPKILGGLSYEIASDIRTSILGTGDAYVTETLNKKIETLPGAQVQIQWNPWETLQLQATAQGGTPLVDQSKSTYALTFAQSYKLIDNLAQTMSVSRFRTFDSDETLVEIGLQWYFSSY